MYYKSMKNSKVVPKLVRPQKSSLEGGGAMKNSTRESMNQTYELSMEKNFKFMSSYANPVEKNSTSFSNYNMK